MDIVVKILQFILSFSLLIFVHELGHFLFARMFGIRVERFQLFFGKALISFKRGDTTYGIGWIPFGGFVTLSGMIDESMNTQQMKQAPKPYEFRSKPAWQRLLTMTGGVIMNVVMAFVIFVCMSYTWGDTYLSTEDMTYGYVFSGEAEKLGFEDGDRILTVNGREIEDFNRLLIAVAVEQGSRIRLLRGGEEIEIVTPTVSVKGLLDSPEFMTPRYPFVVAGTLEGSGAAKAGLLSGDRLTSLAGQPMRFFDQYREKLPDHKETTVPIGIERDSAGIVLHRTFDVEVSPQGTIGATVDMFSLAPVHTRSYTFLQSIPAGVRRVGTEIGGYWKQLKLLVDPKTEAYESVSGPLGIGNIFPEDWDWYRFWSITALLSVVLAVMNILPIPALDGGHVLFLLVEMITGRRPGDKFIVYAQVAGMTLLLLLMVYATGNDIYRMFIR